MLNREVAQDLVSLCPPHGNMPVLQCDHNLPGNIRYLKCGYGFSRGLLLLHRFAFVEEHGRSRPLHWLPLLDQYGLLLIPPLYLLDQRVICLSLLLVKAALNYFLVQVVVEKLVKLSANLYRRQRQKLNMLSVVPESGKV